MIISIFGMGYVGSVSAACLSQMGHKIIGVDINKEKNKIINSGRAPNFEPFLDEIIKTQVKSKSLYATDDFDSAVLQSSISLVCVGTPSKKDGRPNLEYIYRTIETIARAIRKKQDYHLIIIRSTIPPRTISEKVIPTIEKFSGKVVGEGFGVAMNPEFLRESSAIHDFYNPERIVLGTSSDSDYLILKEMYNSTTSNKVHGEYIQVPVVLAELIKYVDNTFHALKVSFANEIGSICRSYDIDSGEMMAIFKKDKKLNISEYYFNPGFSFGGSCLPKDVRGLQTLSRDLNLENPLINSVIDSNDEHTKRFENLIIKKDFKRIGFVGLTFKDDTDDIRENKVIDILEKIAQQSNKSLFVFDPILNESDIKALKLNVTFCANLEDIIQSSDAIVINTSKKQVIKEVIHSKKPVFDLKNVIPKDHPNRFSIV